MDGLSKGIQTHRTGEVDPSSCVEFQERFENQLARPPVGIGHSGTRIVRPSGNHIRPRFGRNDACMRACINQNRLQGSDGEVLGNAVRIHRDVKRIFRDKVSGRRRTEARHDRPHSERRFRHRLFQRQERPGL